MPKQTGSARLSRRAVLTAAFALAACKGRAQDGSVADRGPPPSLKSVAPFPVGCCAQLAELNDPAFAELFARNFSQLTPEWEMKMEYILKDDGTFRFDRPDAIAGFCRQHGVRLYGTTLVWYAQQAAAFARIDGQGKAFADAYRNYILAVAGRYRGQAVGWDVVNEPVAEDGNGLRECLWSRNLGVDGYMIRAFEHAAEADPGAIRFINDYNLESNPTKRATFMRLVERLLKQGAPIGGIGTQTHIGLELPDGAAAAAIRDLAGFGLPIHVSELDISFGRARLDLRPVAEKRALQARKATEVAQAFTALPERQRFAFTLWGLRDQDSWLRKPPNAGDGTDQPLAFDDEGRAKPMVWALADAFRR